MNRISRIIGLMLLVATGHLHAGGDCTPSIEADQATGNLIAGGPDFYVTITIGYGTCDPAETVDYSGFLQYDTPANVSTFGGCSTSPQGTLEPFDTTDTYECGFNALSNATAGDSVIVSGEVQGNYFEKPTAEAPTGTGSQVAQLTVVRETDLELTKTGGGQVLAPDTFGHLISVYNDGPSYATQIIVTDLTDTLPAGVTGPSYGTPSHGSVVDNVWTINELPDGITATLDVGYEATTNTAAGTVHDTANISGNDENAGSTDLEDDETSTVIPAIDIAVTSTESIDPVVAGSGASNLTYVVTATNNGPAYATGVAVSAFLTWPAGVSVVSVTPSVGTWSNAWPGTWTIGNMSNGASRTLTIVLTVGLNAAEGTDVINLSAELSAVNGSDTDTQADNDTTTEATSIRWPTATFRVGKDYTSGDGGPVNVSLECDDTSGLLVYEPQSDTTEASLTVRRFDLTGSGTDCTVVETVPAGYYEFARTEDCDVDPVADQGSYECFITNAPTRATFLVTKDFTDGNPNEVEVTINCFTGLPLQQSQEISEGQSVEFVVTDYDGGELDCDISEVIPNGYSPTYGVDGNQGGTAGGITTDDEGCHFTEVAGGEFACQIVNTPDPVDVDIHKVWVIEGSSDAQDIDTRYKLTLWCEGEIIGGNQQGDAVEAPAGFESQGCGFNLVAGGESGQTNFEGSWCKEFHGDGPDTFNAQVIPEYPDSDCEVIETLYDSAVEVDNDCGNLTVSAGQGAECTITNTVFFEGIPTLNQYGMAILALLMLGVGLVGFRRFN